MGSSIDNRSKRITPSPGSSAFRFKMPIPVIAFLLLFPYTETALADCTPAAPASGDTVVCNGNPNGYSTSGLGNLNVVIEQNTNLNGPFTASSMGALTVDHSGNMQSAVVTDVSSLVFDNHATINGGLTVSGNGTYVVHYYANSHINSAFSFTGNSTNIITNDGTLNNGVTINGDGASNILNTTGASFNNGIFVNGASQTYVQNYGRSKARLRLAPATIQSLIMTPAR